MTRSTFRLLERFGLGLLPYYPLASGLLTGKHKRGATAAGTRLAMPMFSGVVTDANFDVVEKLEAFAKARGHTHAGACVLLARRAPDRFGSIIAGATKPEQIDANVKAVGWELTAEEMKEIDKITKG